MFITENVIKIITPRENIVVYFNNYIIIEKIIIKIPPQLKLSVFLSIFNLLRINKLKITHIWLNINENYGSEIEIK